jgi:hypothetical protein
MRYNLVNEAGEIINTIEIDDGVQARHEKAVAEYKSAMAKYEKELAAYVKLRKIAIEKATIETELIRQKTGHKSAFVPPDFKGKREPVKPEPDPAYYITAYQPPEGCVLEKDE